MKAKTLIFSLLVCASAGIAMAQDRAQSPQSQPSLSRPERQGNHGPPPQAYGDCKGRKAGDAVQHTTPEGQVAATCEDSPEGLVARPSHPPGAPTGH